ncbi:MFS transporter [Nesterenkonia natronophila]|uniref:MFS transporter n=1 Tax=Nesterenkonia natronophila TaxID=2174932 RepID=A0A3A4FBL7_9MICC|nr:MFS transporter [Nesterenkonia natronophila]RJN32507.1 MFS transporter [Nesterenkonia natronophila]
MKTRELTIGLAGMSMIAVAFGFARYGYGLFVPEFRDEFDLSTETLGLISGATYASYLAGLLLAAYLSTRLRPRVPILLGGLCAAGGMIMIAAAPNGAVMAAGAILASTSPGWAWAPFSDAVDQLISADARGRTLSIVSTGTAVGLILAGPIALIAGPFWRAAWIAFAIFALASTLWNARLLPGRSQNPASPTSDPQSAPASHTTLLSLSRWRWTLTEGAYPLYFVAFVFGVASAFYWTYAADLAQESGLPDYVGPILWTIVGVLGLVGVATGDLVKRFGLGAVLIIALILLAAAIAVLGAAPGNWFLVCLSAALYGPSFMMMSALLAVWSSRTFPERPTAGFSAALLLLAAGSIAGPAALGVLAGSIGLPTTFLVAAGLTLVGLVGSVPQPSRRRASTTSG